MTLLDVATANFLDNFSEMFGSIANLSIPEQRAIIKQKFCVPQYLLEPVEGVQDKVVHGRQGPIDVRLYFPKKGNSLPVMVYFHRGGWVYGSIKESEMICRILANATGAIVAAVAYRLAPEHKFPIPLEDCYDATKWVAENAATFSGNPSQLIILGESAGGNLAAAVALMNRNANAFNIAGQVLIYPILTNELHRQSYDDSPDKALLSYENMQFFWDAYLTSRGDGDSPYASPLKNVDCANLPPCLIITADFDALKHEGRAYYQALKASGVKATLKCYPEVIHGFLDLPLAEAIKQKAITDIAEWVKNL